MSHRCGLYGTTAAGRLRAAPEAHPGEACENDREMPFSVRPIDYFYVNTHDEVGAAYHVLSAFAERGVNLLAFTAVPSGGERAQFALFPEDPSRFTAEARSAQIEIEGPHHALFVHGDDSLGRLAGIHERLFKAGVDVYASSGVSDGRGSFGYVVYVREDQFEQAVAALEI